jgi:hypothetical protein
MAKKENLKLFFFAHWLSMPTRRHRSFVAFDVLLYAERSYVVERGDKREMVTETHEAVNHADLCQLNRSCAAFKAKLMHS